MMEKDVEESKDQEDKLLKTRKTKEKIEAKKVRIKIRKEEKKKIKSVKKKIEYWNEEIECTEEDVIYFLPIKPEYKIMEEYWVVEPYAKVKIVSIPHLGGQLAYFVEEAQLTPSEKKVVEKLIDILSVEMKPPASIEEDVKNYVINEAKRLLNKYKRAFRGLSKESWDKIIYYVERDLLGYGPINVMMLDPMLEDISCNGVEKSIYVWHRKYESIPSNVVFLSHDYLREFIIKLAHIAGKHVSTAFPVVDARLPGGHRLAATYGEEISPRGSTFTIRKFREKPFSIIELVEYGTLDAWTAAYLWLMLEHRMTVIVIGGTAAGKTTLLNALLNFIKPAYKLVTIEETPEINIEHENWVQLVSRESYGLGESKTGAIDLYELVRISLRYRPDYIIVGEIRGREAFVLFQAMASVSGDTPILIKRGGEIKLVKISDLVDSFYPDELEKIPIPVDNIQALTLNQNKVVFTPIKYVLRHKADTIFRIKYVGGKIKATESHSVFVMNPNTLEIKTKAVKELRKGDLLISFVKRRGPKEYVYINTLDILPEQCCEKLLVEKVSEKIKAALNIKRNPIPLKELKNKIDTKSIENAVLKYPRGKYLPIKIRVDEDLAFLLGAYIADGCVITGRKGKKIVFSFGKEKEKDIYRRVIKIIKEKFNDLPYIEDRKTYVLLEYNNTLLAYFLEKTCGKNGAEKHVPQELWLSPQSVIRAFFEGLKADARRKTKRRHQLTIIQKNRKLIQQLSWLARIGGFNVRLRESGKYYEITINYIPSHKPFLGDGIPINVLRYLYHKLSPRNMPLKYTYVLVNKKRRQKLVRKDTALEILDWIISNKTKPISPEEKCIIERIYKLANGEIVLHPVTEISEEEYDGYVYDISIPGNEAFLGGENPILLHNTGHGGLSTFHADSLENVVRRLMSSPMNVSEPYISLMNIVVHIERTPLPRGGYGRRVKTVWEIKDYGNYIELIKWNPLTDKHEVVNESYLLTVLSLRTGIPISELKREIEDRKKIIEWLIENKIRDVTDVSRIITKFYMFPEEVKKMAKAVVPITPSTSERVLTTEKAEVKVEAVSPSRTEIPEEKVIKVKPTTVESITELSEDEIQTKILELIYNEGKPLDYKTIAKRLNIDPLNIWGYVRELNKKKLIKNRVVYSGGAPLLGFELTEEGKKYIEEVMKGGED